MNDDRAQDVAEAPQAPSFVQTSEWRPNYGYLPAQTQSGKLVSMDGSVYHRSSKTGGWVKETRAITGKDRRQARAMARLASQAKTEIARAEALTGQVVHIPTDPSEVPPETPPNTPYE